MKPVNILGKKIGRLTVVRQLPTLERYGRKYSYWECKCECGNVFNARGQVLIRGEINSCGCYKLESISNRTFKHGIKVICVSLPNFETAAMGAFVKVGSRYEQRSESGICHFLEHMAFKGTTNRSNKQLLEEGLSTVGLTSCNCPRRVAPSPPPKLS